MLGCAASCNLKSACFRLRYPIALSHRRRLFLVNFFEPRSGAKGLEVEFGEDLELVKQRREFAARKLLAQFLVDGAALLNENRTAAIAVRSEFQK
jgi:hypothetical protein